ncbi:OmpA family protein [Paraburkholderia domus]|uniref:OmpA family protein n=1 Tax=Paraburkholderia domus TaxID=2793075 RepID=UPI0019116A71|nr:OmpA family protein [Paraburkholderia domus]MBK5047536.1 OmpA family protein [Burkholderia sp. R-70006]MBK5062845.1 OmpA family protein [Burkholderia sp. R-70199]CAE6685943.1 Peptidoglycan-associated lipoprotein [Paraburkholderia domus]CAE6906667.1 Peptidoglycan-associated lipoprotein [Paraburkholderia domus]
MSINVIQLVQSALTDSVVRQLAARFGLPPDATQKVLATTGPALVAGLMQKGATLDGARSLFATIVSSEVNGHIAEQLPQLLGSTTGVSQLEGVGRHLLERALDRRVDTLSDEVATQTGVPAHATHAMTGIVGATLLGLLKRHFLEGQGNVGQLPTLLGHQLPAIAPYLNDRLMAGLGLSGLGAFTGNILSQLKAVSAHIDHPTPAAKPVAEALSSVRVPADAVVREERRSRKWLWWLLAAIAAVLAFLFLRGCHNEQQGEQSSERSGTEAAAVVQPASASAEASAAVAPASDVAASTPAASAAAASEAQQPAAAPAPTKDSQLSFTVDTAGKPTLTATVGSEAEKAQLIDALTKRFGADRFVANITVDQDTKPADWLAHLDGLLPLMALPGAEVKVDGAHIELSGSAANAKLGWLDKLKSLFGASYQIGSFNVEQAVANATENFRGAIKNLLTPDSSCAASDVVKVLNLQVINFTSASARVPASALEDLNQSAQVLNACVRNGKTAKLEVAGYSDNVGGAQANLQLSKKRAEAVRAYLVKTGVPADSLVAQGYGDARPVASNDTASGRFANRRIEFVAQP